MAGEKRREIMAQAGFWMAKRASRNQSPLDKFCRWVLNRLLKTEFQVDEMVVEHQGFDPDELSEYEKGPSRLP